MKRNIKKVDKKIFIIVGILFITVLGSGCVEHSSTSKIDVLVSIIPQREMVEAIGGDLVSVTAMVPEGQSPHSYEPTPSQMVTVAKAKAYFIVGSGVEFESVHLDAIIEQNQDLQVVDCSETIDVISFDEHYGQEDYHEGEHDGEHDHEQGGTDPHIWLSPVNYKKMAESVYKGIIEIDPSNQSVYEKNYQTYIQDLDGFHNNISTLLQPFSGRSFMVYHPAWGYFGDAYQLTQIAIEEDGKQPGPAGVAAIIQQAKNESITVIFVSPQFDTSSAQTIADEIGGSVVSADPLMNDYKETLLTMASDIVAGFTGP